MAGGESLDQNGYSRKLITGESVGNDEHSAMGALVVEESNQFSWFEDGQFDVIHIVTSTHFMPITSGYLGSSFFFSSFNSSRHI